MSVRSSGSLVDLSIKDIIASADPSRLVAVPSPAGDGETYAEYANSVDGFRQKPCLICIKMANGGGVCFVCRIRGTLTLPADRTAKTIPSTVGK